MKIEKKLSLDLTLITTQETVQSDSWHHRLNFKGKRDLCALSTRSKSFFPGLQVLSCQYQLCPLSLNDSLPQLSKAKARSYHLIQIIVWYHEGTVKVGLVCISVFPSVFEMRNSDS